MATEVSVLRCIRFSAMASANPFDEADYAPLRTAEADAEDFFATLVPEDVWEQKTEASPAEATAAEATSVEATTAAEAAAGADHDEAAGAAAEPARVATRAAAVRVSPPRFGEEMEHGCHALLRSGRHSDLSFVVGSETMPAHRAILEARCGAALVQALEGGGIGVTESLAIGAEGAQANPFDGAAAGSPATATPPAVASGVLVVRLESFSPASVALLLRFLCADNRLEQGRLPKIRNLTARTLLQVHGALRAA